MTVTEWNPLIAMQLGSTVNLSTEPSDALSVNPIDFRKMPTTCML